MRNSVLSRRALALAALSVGGCSSFLSESGPRQGTVVDGASILIGDVGEQQKLAYALVRVAPGVLSRLVPLDRPSTFSPDLANVTSGGGAIGVGDFVAVTIFESGAGGLFIPAESGARSGNYVTLPAQQVDGAGNISIPFAGAVHVAGQTPAAVGRVLQDRLSDRALEPQAVVTITDRRANAINVTGDVNTSARFALDPGGERLLGAIARAGGPKYPPYETVITLQRGGGVERTFLSEVVRDPRQNVPLLAGDTVLVSREQRYFLALGALGPGQYLGLVNRRLAFDDSRLSLADAIAKVGGLSDDRANSRAVFVYRFEPRETLTSLGATMAPGAGAATQVGAAQGAAGQAGAGTVTGLPPTIPTIYYLDLAEAAGYFFASQFPVRNEDLIYVSNAPSTDLGKFLNLILPAAYSAASFRTL